jgi:phosphoadenosine phosphosulfate reductase
VQLTLDGRTTLDRSIDILREYEPDEGYYLAFSGGKDSCVLKHVADMAGVKYDAHYNMTTIDPPEVTRFIKKHHPDVEWHVPKKPFWKMVEVNGLPFQTGRWCCRYYKEIGGVGRKVLTGIRAEESRQRAKRGVFSTCSKLQKWYINPLLEWTSSDIWGHIRNHGLPYCSLYDEGWDRIGCVVCPFENDVDRSMERWPVFWRLAKDAGSVYFQRSKSFKARWNNFDEMFDWWIHRKRAYPKKRDDRPPSLSFEEDVNQ